jgi:anaerobic magnesium-protoporphyrin IX monomethyl ester cyclase
MKILLIQPFANESNTNYPPLGLSYLAAYIRAKSQHEVKILDLRVKKSPIETKTEEISDWKPDIIGVTGMSIEWSGIRRVAEHVKNILGSDATLIAGGPHATCFSQLVIDKTPVDFVVRGEGEKTFLSLIGAIESNTGKEDTKGLFFRKDNACIDTGKGEIEENPDDMPFPAFDLLNVETYFVNPHFHTNLNKYNRIMPILTSRGCPFQCSFCFHTMGFKFRPRSADNVLNEIGYLIETYNIKEIHIEDDTFNFKIDRAKDIMSGIIERGYRLAIAFPNGIRGDIVDQELIALFKEAGVYRIHFGIESASPRIQKMICKSLDFDRLNNSINMATRAKISSHGFFMIGFPTETEEEILQTINYAAQSNLATANFSIVQMFPGTALSENALKDMPEHEDDFSFSYDFVTTDTGKVSVSRIKALQRISMTRFYFRPSRIWRIFVTSPNKKNLFFRNLLDVLSIIFKEKTKY